MLRLTFSSSKCILLDKKMDEKLFQASTELFGIMISNLQNMHDHTSTTMNVLNSLLFNRWSLKPHLEWWKWAQSVLSPSLLLSDQKEFDNCNLTYK